MKTRIRLLITAAAAIGALVAMLDPWPFGKKEKEEAKKIKCVILLNHNTGEVTVIHLTDEERQTMLDYDSVEDFLLSIEDKYGFKLMECSYTYSADDATIKSYGNEENKAEGTVEEKPDAEPVVQETDDVATGDEV